jgi:class 3 adenylate cyclase
VVISTEVAELAQRIRLDDMGPVSLKGVAVPMRLFRARR